MKPTASFSGFIRTHSKRTKTKLKQLIEEDNTSKELTQNVFATVLTPFAKKIPVLFPGDELVGDFLQGQKLQDRPDLEELPTVRIAKTRVSPVHIIHGSSGDIRESPSLGSIASNFAADIGLTPAEETRLGRQALVSRLSGSSASFEETRVWAILCYGDTKRNVAIRLSDNISALDADVRRVFPELTARLSALEDISGCSVVSGLEVIEGQWYNIVTDAGPAAQIPTEFQQRQQFELRRQQFELQRQQSVMQQQQIDQELQLIRSSLEAQQLPKRAEADGCEKAAEKLRRLLERLDKE
ncbi:hypothetical protein HK102_004266, partial [Quaeritorhiza haematococci]